MQNVENFMQKNVKTESGKEDPEVYYCCLTFKFQFVIEKESHNGPIT